MYLFRSAHVGVTISTNILSTFPQGLLSMLWKSKPTLGMSDLYYTAASSHSLEAPIHYNFTLTFPLALEQFYGVNFFLFHGFKQVAYFIQHKIWVFPCFRTSYIFGKMSKSQTILYFSHQLVNVTGVSSCRSWRAYDSGILLMLIV